MLQVLKPVCLEPVLGNKRSHGNEKQRRVAPAAAAAAKSLQSCPTL